MKRLFSTLVLFALLASSTFAQNIVNEAKANIETKHHKAMVEKAEKLLCEKKELEAKLAAVNAKLAKLDAGEDVKVDEAATASGVVWNTGAYYATPITITGTPIN